MEASSGNVWALNLLRLCASPQMIAKVLQRMLIWGIIEQF